MIHLNRYKLCTEFKPSVVATTRNRFPSDSGAFADWVSSTSSSVAAVADRAAANAHHHTPEDDLLSLSFNAGPSAAAGRAPTGPTTTGMWSSARTTNAINYGPTETGMTGLRDVFVVTPATSSSFHHNSSHHHEPSIMSDPSNTSTALGVGVGVGVNVIPILSASPCFPNTNIDTDNMINNRHRVSGGIQLWQDQYLKRQQGLVHPQTNNPSPGNFVPISGGIGLSASTAMTSSTTTCQDCGNQAKKDCSHRRCRTCCKSRGFECSTHVKSTWVPAARRKERQVMAAAAVGTAGSTASTSGAKKPRLVASQTTTTSHTSTSNTPSRSYETSSSHQDASFKESLPSQVRAPAVFKCVRVTGIENGEDEFAYQAAVKIGGHVFKGFLYDQGVENREGYPNLSDLHLGGGSSGNGDGGARGISLSSPILDPSDVYAASGGFLGGSVYGNPIN